MSSTSPPRARRINRKTQQRGEQCSRSSSPASKFKRLQGRWLEVLLEQTPFCLNPDILMSQKRDLSPLSTRLKTSRHLDYSSLSLHMPYATFLHFNFVPSAISLKTGKAHPCTGDSSHTDWETSQEHWHPDAVFYLINTLLIRDSCNSSILSPFLLLSLEGHVLLELTGSSVRWLQQKGIGWSQSFPRWRGVTLGSTAFHCPAHQAAPSRPCVICHADA